MYTTVIDKMRAWLETKSRRQEICVDIWDLGIEGFDLSLVGYGGKYGPTTSVDWDLSAADILRDYQKYD